ncbi:MAG: hypothetical protein A3G81_14140 [Betaproteobacteria bacterium RIFCSPLOWO2_12_FULL_65_14]|nr:MAG: hypothetical protein A3G81_14140 [Betaproteobacteria bacterium RIFCSPLOWO2_12_FULL_65_14]
MAPAAVALAFETVDTLPWPSSGRFPAYPAEDARPTTLWVQGGVMRDDNVLRLESGAQNETIARLGAGFRHEQRIVGRQRLAVEARGDAYRYDRFSELDHFAYSALGDWRWEVGNELSGSVILGREKRLVDISETQVARRDMVTATRFGATGGYLVTPSVRLRAGLARGLAERSLRADAETRADAITVGADYVSPLGNALGIEGRKATGDAPVPERVAPAGTFVNNDYDEREVALVATYAAGPQLRGEGRVGRTKRTYTEIPGRDFDGTTGRLRVEWLPGNKTILGFEAYKEPRSLIDIAASHVVAKGFAFGPSWAATAKLVFAARFIRERRTFEGDPTLFLVPGTPLRDETINTLRFGVGWEPLRHWQASFAIDRGERESNAAGRDYQYNAVTANLAWRW